MSESEFLGNLKQGAEACHSNAIRLLADAEILFANKSYLSCFLLSELALEEMAKGFKLLEKDQKKERFSRKDWEGFTQGAKAHKKKLI